MKVEISKKNLAENNKVVKNNNILKEKKEEQNKNNEDKKIDKKMKNEKRITCFKLIMNLLLSIVLVVFFLYIPHTYEKKWKIFFFMTLWSFSMNSYYIVSVTIIDWVRFLKKNDDLFICYNNFVRNRYIRICFPFAISIVFLYWMLILLGDDFEYRGRDVSDTAVGVFFHGMILIFLLFDMFTSWHKNIKDYFLDLFIITGLVIIYFFLLGIGKYIIKYEPYDFMEISSVNQIVGACILIYIAILDGYVVLNLLANRFFEQVEENKK